MFLSGYHLQGFELNSTQTLMENSLDARQDVGLDNFEHMKSEKNLY